MAKTSLRAGTTLDGFVIGERVHVGGMAILYSVTHPDHDLPMLIKVPLLSDGEDPAAIVSFEMEQMILPRLSGPHVPRFIAAGEFTRQPYLVVERIAGETLFKQLTMLPLPSAAVAEIGAKIATAIHALHSQNVIHLDIKPSNIIFRQPGGEVVLLDYGLSRHDQLPDLMHEEFRLPYGTAPYMAPEQVFGIRNDPRSDLFALGALMYFFATGQRPFGNPQSLRGLQKRLWRDPIPPRRLVPDMPRWLQDVILRCLAPDPEVRHPTASQLAFDLAHPEQVQLTPRADKLQRDPLSVVIRRRFHPESYDPKSLRQKRLATVLSSAPIVAVALDLDDSEPPVLDAIRVTVQRILETVPNARLACINVMRLNLLTLDQKVDADGHNIHVQRLARLHDWARAISIPIDRVSFHVLEAVNAGAAILDHVQSNHVDHVVLGAQTSTRLRNILGSVATEISQKAPCTVTIVRKTRTLTGDLPTTT